MTKGDYVLLVEDNPDEVFLAQRVFKKGEVANPLKVVADGRQGVGPEILTLSWPKSSQVKLNV